MAMQRDKRQERTFSWRRLRRMTSPGNCAAFWALLVVAVVLFRDPFLVLWWHEKPLQSRTGVTIPLDMETESIDDMFAGCRSEMAALIDQIGVFEWHANKQFSEAWAYIEKQAKRPAHTHFRDDHTKVLYMYTFWNLKNFREKFDQTVKALKRGYSTYGFRFHYLYFYLTDAIQMLRGNQTWCRTTYFRTNKHFSEGVINKEIRLGSFTLAASSNRSHLSSGKISCFEIYTCFGADISYYSAIREDGQVLIPPYEVFKVTDVLTRKDQECAAVYKLQSTRTPKSDLNCKLGPRKPKLYFTDFRSFVVFLSESASLVLLVIVSVVLIKLRQGYFVVGVVGTLLVVMVITEMFASQSV